MKAQPRKLYHLTTLILLLLTPSLFSQEYFNLDFESTIPSTNLPVGWSLSGSSYKISRDTIIKYKGFSSLSFDCFYCDKTDFGMSMSNINWSTNKKKTIKLKGKIKTDSLKNGYAGLWMRADGVSSTLGFENMSNRGFSGTNEWKEAEIVMEVDSNTISIYFGALITGYGRAWFDDFEIYIDDLKHEDIEPVFLEPTKEQLDLLKSYVYPLASFEPEYESTVDLEILDSLMINANVVGLGESTHGSSEIFKLKHRLIKYLAKKNKNTIFSIEASMPESERINSFITQGSNDSINDLLIGLNYWVWNTKEMLDLVLWMKEINKDVNQIKYTGFDIYPYNGAIEELKLAFEHNIKIQNSITELEKSILRIDLDKQITLDNSVLDNELTSLKMQLVSLRQFIKNSSHSKFNKDWLMQNCRLIEQHIDDNSAISRDIFMAENVLWIANTLPSSKIILCAHNEHIKKTNHSMGSYLLQSIEDKYLSIGFAFFEGEYNAITNNKLECCTSQNAYLGTYEYILNKLDHQIFVFDLKKLKYEQPNLSKWFNSNLKFRVVGALKEENEFKSVNLNDDYDIIIFLKKSSCSEILESK